MTVLSHEKSANRHMRRAIEETEWWLSLSPDRYALFESEIRDALDRGVTVRLVVATTDSEENVGTNGFPDGLRVRTRQISGVLVAADRAYSVYSGGMPTNSGRSYHVVANQSLTLQFQHYYEQIWSSSRIVQEAISLPARYLNPWRAIIDSSRSSIMVTRWRCGSLDTKQILESAMRGLVGWSITN
ncbi:TrmB family transcriptional regulator sugar-binding domain-containing protein [Natronosalvus rutilus]|uniref:TrmB family transcriptional regulator sugar-binding domain-containing protein n=1 Tax=Natronosalvus rutilus TaxID=2953753 RepID=UPI003CCDC7C3